MRDLSHHWHKGLVLNCKLHLLCFEFTTGKACFRNRGMGVDIHRLVNSNLNLSCGPSGCIPSRHRYSAEDP